MRKDLLGISISLFVLVISACERVENLDDLESRLSLLENADLQKDSLYLKSISFLSDNNPRLLVDNLYGEILGDSVATCWSRHIMANKYLKPSIETVGADSIFVDEMLCLGGQIINMISPGQLHYV